VTPGRWYARPEGDGLVLRKSPRLASWNKATDHDQVQLRQYMEDTAELVAPALVSGPWAILLDVGLPVGRDLIDMADLDNYALPLAPHLSTEHLAPVWCSKRHAQTSRAVVVPAQEVPAPTRAARRRTGLVRDSQSTTRESNYRECRPGLHAKLSTKEWRRRFAYRLLASPGTRLKPLAPRYLGESCRHLDHSVPLADHFLRGIVSILDFVPLT
jgi:hypothetical protein